MKGNVKNLNEGKKIILKVLKYGEDLEKFRLMMICKGVNEVNEKDIWKGDMWSVMNYV